ncbi:MAG: hypothetical protein HUJ27_07500 [Rhodobacteraceae bacterium]|nr:hypothetical protein [Paracoccaceae bacterium]
MEKSNSADLFKFLLVVFGLLAASAILSGGVYISGHEGDSFHLLEIVFRMADGEWPHLDFLTPIGALAFAPIVLFVEMGFGVGESILFAQVLVAAILLPAAWWAATTRLEGIWPYLFGAAVLILALALVHGETNRSASTSMHYNRWAWALSYIVVLVAVLPQRFFRANATVDGVIIGLGMAVLALTKMTYFVAFAVPVAAALIQRKAWRELTTAALAGLAVFVVVTLFAGLDYWLAYMSDLLRVTQTEVRAYPGQAFVSVAGAPAYIAGTAALFGGVIFLRQAGEMRSGLLLFLLAPAFIFVTYQNFGNDPQWLVLLGILLFAMLPEAGITNSAGWDMRRAISYAAVAALALEAGSFVNLAYSPVRHMAADRSGYLPVLPDATVHSDYQSVDIRVARLDARIAMEEQFDGLERWTEAGDREDPTVFQDEKIRYCTVELGLSAWFDLITKDLEANGFAQGKRIFAADLFSSFWLFGDTERLVGGAPWYYGGLSGYDSADYLLVPICPVADDIRHMILEEVTERGETLEEVHRHSLYILYATGRG